MKLYYDYRGENPLSGAAIKTLILGDDFLIAWYTVCVYIMGMELTPFHMQIMAFQYNNIKSLVMAGRGFGKSFVLNTAYALTLVLRDPNIRIAVATQNTSQATKFVNELKNYFNEGQVIFDIFGNLKGDKWQETQIFLKRTKVLKEATVTTGSMNASGSFISSHFDILILDDIVGEENARTRGQREKLKNYLYNTVVPTLELQNGYGFIHCIGTHYHPDDLWKTLENSGQFTTLKIPSLFKDKNGKDRSVWEKKKGVKDLKSTKELIGPVNFNMQYQQRVPEEKGGVFKADWLQYFSKFEVIKDKVFVEYTDEEELMREPVKIFLGVDLAISMKANADSFVIATVGVGEITNNLYILDLFRGKLSFNEQVNKIKEYGKKWYTVERIGIESVAYQSALSNELLRITNLPVVKIKTLKDKMTRFNKFSGKWENKRVYIYDKLKEYDTLEAETLGFPNEDHDDTIDAVCLAWETIESNAGKVITTPKRKPTGL